LLLLASTTRLIGRYVPDLTKHNCSYTLTSRRRNGLLVV
jgi:hypothetical protein